MPTSVKAEAGAGGDLRQRLHQALGDRFQVGERLGSGGFAHVYIAHDQQLKREVAVKVLRPDLVEDPALVERFHREAKTIANLHHPNLVPIHDVGQADGLAWFIMPRLRGETLREALAGGPFAPKSARQILVQVAEGLQAAHEAGVIHRDVKPENVMLVDGRAMLMDFGIAKTVESDEPRLTAAHQVIGTPHYMSPEQASGDELDARSDIYSLGCLAYELLSGRPPFEGETPAALARHHIATAPTALGGIPGDLEHAVMRCLEKAPENRWQDVRSFVGEIATEAPSGRGLGVVALAGTGIALLAGGAWWLFAGGGGSAGAPAIDRLAVLPLSNLMNDPEHEYFVQGMHDRLISELQQAGVSVIARTSVMAYGEGATPVREIAQELQVDAVIEGSVFRAGDSVEIEARLVDGTTEEYLWRQTFSGSLRQVVMLHRDLTRAIAREIRSALGAEERARLAAVPAVDPRAYEAYLKGIFHLHRRSAANLDAALEHFERALRFDSAYAPAYVGITGVWGTRAQDGYVTAAEAREHWEPALDRALALDPDLPEANAAAAGFAAWADWDWERGVERYDHAIELNPGDAVSRALYAHLLSILGRWEEAEEQVEAALELDPLNPFVQGLGATQLWLAGRHEDAVGILRGVFRSHPDAVFGRNVLAAALHASGREQEAFEAWREYYAMRGDESVLTALEEGYREGGYARAYRLAAEAMAAAASNEYRPAFDVADAWVRAGETERAIPWYEAALAERDQNMPYIGVLPLLEPLHDNPRFRELARRVGVPVPAASATR